MRILPTNPRPRETRASRPPLVAVLLLLGFCLATAGFAGVEPAPVEKASERPGICFEGTGKAAVELTWKGLDDDGSVLKPHNTIMTLGVENRSTRELFVDLSVAAVLDDRRESLDLGMVYVATGTESLFSFDLLDFGVNPGLLDFSGRLVAKAVARIDQGAPAEAIAYSPHAFFHEEDRQLYLYRRTALRKHFASGDFGDRALKVRQWVAKRGLRLTAISYYDPDLPLTDDDGGPPDQDPPHGRRTPSHKAHAEITP